MHEAMHHMIYWLRLHPHWGGIAAFVVAFLESVAIIGTIVPSAIFITAIGILAGSGVIGFWSTIILTILGAIAGDSLSYFTGYFFKDKLIKSWPFNKNKQWLDKGYQFFDKHGGKSILVGRFIGPIRALIPLIAGMLHLKPIRFFPVDIFSAALWAPIYLAPGLLIGFASLALPAPIATKLILLCFGIAILAWLLFMTIQWVIKHISKRVDRLANVIWYKMLDSKIGRLICPLLFDADHPYHHGQLSLCFALILSVLIFLFVFLNIAWDGPLLIANEFVHHFFRGLRNPYLDHVFVFLTSFGKLNVIFPLAFTLFAYLFYTKKRRAAIHWFVVCFLSAGIAFAFRYFYYNPRPPGIAIVKSSSSFPSGHVVLSAALYTFICWMICLDKPQWKKWAYGFTLTFVGMVCFTRLYLGEHWMTDILGSLFLSLSCIILVVISYHRKKVSPPNAYGILITLFITLCITLPIYLYRHYDQLYNDATPVWIKHSLSSNEWWNKRNIIVPLYAEDRLGRPAVFLNLQWMGGIERIHYDLKRDGWIDLHSKAAKPLLKKLKKEHKIDRLALFPQLYHDQKPALVMIKQPHPNAKAIILHLWPANVILKPEDYPLWIGTITYQRKLNHLIFNQYFHVLSKAALLDTMQSVLARYQWKTVDISKKMLPDHLTMHLHVKPYVLLLGQSKRTIRLYHRQKPRYF